jgi:hypothetical protein
LGAGNDVVGLILNDEVVLRRDAESAEEGNDFGGLDTAWKDFLHQENEGHEEWSLTWR